MSKFKPHARPYKALLYACLWFFRAVERTSNAHCPASLLGGKEVPSPFVPALRRKVDPPSDLWHWNAVFFSVTPGLSSMLKKKQATSMLFMSENVKRAGSSFTSLFS